MFEEDEYNVPGLVNDQQAPYAKEEVFSFFKRFYSEMPPKADYLKNFSGWLFGLTDKQIDLVKSRAPVFYLTPDQAVVKLRLQIPSFGDPYHLYVSAGKFYGFHCLIRHKLII
jgi:hypothetical protein